MANSHVLYVKVEVSFHVLENWKEIISFTIMTPPRMQTTYSKILTLMVLLTNHVQS